MTIYDFLAQLHIPFERHEHAAVATYDAAEEVTAHLRGAGTKNLFLRDDKGRRHFLVVVPGKKKVELRQLGEVLGSGKLSFASAERLGRHLGVEPGAVTLLALINDPTHTVEVFLDAALWEAEALQCHPLKNTETLVIDRDDIERFLQATGHGWRLISVPEKER